MMRRTSELLQSTNHIDKILGREPEKVDKKKKKKKKKRRRRGNDLT